MKLIVRGVTFASLQAALTDLYFRTPDMTQEQFDEARKYVVPMQHNFVNPLQPGSGDTIIQYWINVDDRLTQDRNIPNKNINEARKLAWCTVRFIGVMAEEWAKSFLHLTQRKSFDIIFSSYCNARVLEYVGPIVISNIDYFGAANSARAYTINFKLEYLEELDFSEGSGGDRLEYIGFPAGEIFNREVTGG